MKKIVLKLELCDEREKKKAMKIVAGQPGVDSLSMEMKDKKLTVIGDVDPVCMTCKLRKFCRTDIISVGPAKEEKKEEPPKKKDSPKDEVSEIFKHCHPWTTTVYSVEWPYEQPSACVIC